MEQLKPTVYITRLAHTKIMHWINMTNLEVSGFGKCEFHRDEKNKPFFIVSDVILLKQEVGAAHTDIDPASLGKALFETKDIPGDLNFWWHSHVNMNVFWSTVDKDTINELGAQGYCLASVFNKKEEVRTALSFKNDSKFGSSLSFEDDLTMIIYDPELELQRAAWDKEFKEKVAEEKVIFLPGAQGGGFSSGFDNSPKRCLKIMRRAMNSYMAPFTENEVIKINNLIETYTKNRTDLKPNILELSAILGLYPYEVEKAYPLLNAFELKRTEDIIDLFLETSVGFGEVIDATKPRISEADIEAASMPDEDDDDPYYSDPDAAEMQRLMEQYNRGEIQ